ncbi:MAG: cyclic nucleotide-binding domain-containing protein [Betaproteobacteria bacterium]
MMDPLRFVDTLGRTRLDACANQERAARVLSAQSDSGAPPSEASPPQHVQSGDAVRTAQILTNVRQAGTAMNKRRGMPGGSARTALKQLLLIAEPGLITDALVRSFGQMDDVNVVSFSPWQEPGMGIDANVVVLDLDSVGDRAIDYVCGFRARHPLTPLVAIGGGPCEPAIEDVLSAGASGYLSRAYREPQALNVLRDLITRASEKATAARACSEAPGEPLSKKSKERTTANRYGLTQSELQILSLLCEGLTGFEIARRRVCGVGTVKSHTNKIYKKLNVANCKQAVRVGHRLEEVLQLALGRAGDQTSIRDWILPYAKFESKPSGELLFRKGDPGRVLYFIQKGRVALLEINVQMGEGELFGEIGIFDPVQLRTCTARCETDVKLFSLTGDEARRLFFEHPQFAYHLMQLTMRRLQADTARTSTVRERLTIPAQER